MMKNVIKHSGGEETEFPISGTWPPEYHGRWGGIVWQDEIGIIRRTLRHGKLYGDKARNIRCEFPINGDVDNVQDWPSPSILGLE